MNAEPTRLNKPRFIIETKNLLKLKISRNDVTYLKCSHEVQFRKLEQFPLRLRPWIRCYYSDLTASDVTFAVFSLNAKHRGTYGTVSH